MAYINCSTTIKNWTKFGEQNKPMKKSLHDSSSPKSMILGWFQEDVMSCIDWLAEKNHQRHLDSLILVGWSMGSAAVIEVWRRVFGIQPKWYVCLFIDTIM